jgi:hypothetical protein
MQRKRRNNPAQSTRDSWQAQVSDRMLSVFRKGLPEQDDPLRQVAAEETGVSVTLFLCNDGVIYLLEGERCILNPYSIGPGILFVRRDNTGKMEQQGIVNFQIARRLDDLPSPFLNRRFGKSEKMFAVRFQMNRSPGNENPGIGI